MAGADKCHGGWGAKKLVKKQRVIVGDEGVCHLKGAERR